MATMDTSLEKISDLVHRRTKGHLKEDGVNEIWTYTDGKQIYVAFILQKHLDTMTLASISTRYIRLFQDIPDFNIHVMDNTNSFSQKKEAFILYTDTKGFVCLQH